jgi:O-antigen ligase
MIAFAIATVVFAGCLVWQLDPAYTLSLAIVLSPIAGNWQQLGIPGALAPDRLLLTAGILQVLFRAPAVRDRPPLRLRAAHVFQALAVLYAVGSAVAAGALSSRAQVFRIVDAFGVLPFLTFLVAPIAFRTERQRAVLLVALVGLGCYLSLTVVFEVARINALVFPKYILNLKYGIHIHRGRGPFVDAVANGFGLFVCAVACVVALTKWSRRGPRALAAMTAVLCVVGILLSVERSVWIGAVAASVVAVLCAPRLVRYFVPAAAVAAGAVAAALLLIPGLPAQVRQRYNAVGTIWDRKNLAVAALNMIEAKPLTGFGWGRFQAESQDYFRQSQSYPLTATAAGVHNFALLYAVELGIPGMTLWVTALLTGIGAALLARGPPEIAPWRTGLIALFVIFVVVANAVPPTLFANLSLWLWAGVVLSGDYATRGADHDSADDMRGAVAGDMLHSWYDGSFVTVPSTPSPMR